MPPAPSRRNVGASLAKQVTTARHTDNIGDARDRHVASRARHAEKWDRISSDLEQRAAQARVDAERAHRYVIYDDDVKQGRATPPVPLLPLASIVTPGQPRYWLGYCLRCEVEMWVHRPRPMVPVCTRCKAKAQRKRSTPTQHAQWEPY